MKKIKLISVILALVLVITCFAACGDKTPDATNTDATASDATATDATASDTDAEATSFEGVTLTMGSSCDFAPYEYLADDGSYTGIDIDIAQAVCDKLGATLVVKDMDFNGIIAAVESGAVSFGMSGMTITEARKESVNFSTPYETAIQAILVKEDSDITGPADLEGKKIGVQAGTTGDDYCTEDFGQENVNQYTKYSLAVQALTNGQVDCIVLDGPVAEEFCNQYDGLKVLDTSYATEEYAAAFNKADTDLLAAFNGALAELEADGTLDAIFAKYAD